VDNVRSRPWEDEDALLGNLGAAVSGPGRVPDSVREAGRAAFALRTAGAGVVVASVDYDSLLDDGRQLRTDEPAAPRLLTFQAEGLCVEIELTEDRVVGQLIPPAAGEVAMMTVEGVAGQTEADSMGCFVLSRPAPGPVRFRCRIGESTVVTDWVRL
jgi:hypothetical protein